MKDRPKSIITGTGHYVPERIVSNFDLEKMMETSDEWIRQMANCSKRTDAGFWMLDADRGPVFNPSALGQTIFCLHSSLN